MSITFEELSGSPKYSFGFAGHKATRRGLIAWSDIRNLVLDVFPPSFGADTSGFSGIGKTYPSPFADALRVNSVSAEPFTERHQNPDTTKDFDTLASYTQALVTIEYTTPKFPDIDEEDPTELLTHKWTAGAEFLTLPSTALQWATDSTAVSSDISPGRLIPTVNHTVTWPRVKRPPFAAIRSLVGTVNSSAFKMRTGTAAPETLLFVGADLEQSVMSDGARAWTVTYHFSEKQTEANDNGGVGTWNSFWRNEEGSVGFYELETTSSAKIYPTGNTSALFQNG